MCKVILFAGTTEGRKLAEFLEARKVRTHVCVATEYGQQLLPSGEFLEISHERLSEKEMEDLILEKGCPIVIDATHPYAKEVTENIQQACTATEASYVRVLREGSADSAEGSVYVDSVEEAVSYLENTKGAILVTTGSKEAAKYTALTGYQDRVFLRVLSLAGVAKQCQELGFEGRNLICMQGPFSTELNAAMLRQWNCRYLVTKISGRTGGFEEKVQAAAMCDCTLVIIGRPLKEEGVSLIECKKMLCDRFSLVSQAEIALVGIGMGSLESRTIEADHTIKEADLLIGAKRMLDACEQPGTDHYIEYDSKKIAAYIQQHPEYEKIAVVLSGDVGFCSGAKKLLEALNGNVRVISGISSVVYFMSRIQKSWDDVYLTSVHGKKADLVSLIRHHKKVFSILGEKDAVAKLAEKLIAFGLQEAVMYVGERLSYKDEKISSGHPQDFLGYETDTLSVIYVECAQAAEYMATHGLADSEFLRGKAPMTKEEVRCVSLAKLGLKEDAVCYDVGAGTGSVAIEMALRARSGRVYAIEKKPEAVELLEKNREKFAVSNLEICEGLAPAALKELEMPTHAFIGGSSGNMEEILRVLLEKNPSIRIVINCIALESVSEALRCVKELPFTETEIVQLEVSRAKEVGPYHMMMGENPIYIISCTGKGKIVDKERN